VINHAPDLLQLVRARVTIYKDVLGINFTSKYFFTVSLCSFCATHNNVSYFKRAEILDLKPILSRDKFGSSLICEACHITLS